MVPMEDIEYLEAAFEEVFVKYGYARMAITRDNSGGPWLVEVTYKDGQLIANLGDTLREALSNASVNALNRDAEVGAHG